VLFPTVKEFSKSVNS